MELYQCFNCDQSEMTVPLVSLRYAGRPAWVCSECLPLLIHQSHLVIHKLQADPETSPNTPGALNPKSSE